MRGEPRSLIDTGPDGANTSHAKERRLKKPSRKFKETIAESLSRGSRRRAENKRKAGVLCEEDPESSDSEPDTARQTWVQCDHLTCHKWRVIPFGSNIDVTR